MDKIYETFNLITDFPRIANRSIFKFVKKELEIGNIWSFYFKPKDGFKMRAGEHLLLNLKHKNPDDRGTIRFYSPSSAPQEELIRITTRYFGDESSSFKKAMFEMNEGEEISVIGPIGKFVINNFEKEYVFIASGVGITPFRSILVDLNNRKVMPRIKMYYINKSVEILFKDQLMNLSKLNDNFQIDFLNGTEEISEDTLRDNNSRSGMFYLAGSPDFVSKQKKRLKDLGVSPFRIKFDSFRKAKGK